MARQVQFRRGSTLDHESFTGVEGEVTVDTDKKTLVVHDGETVGGFPLAQATPELENVVASFDVKSIVVIDLYTYASLLQPDPKTLYIIKAPNEFLGSGLIQLYGNEVSLFVDSDII